MHMSIILISTSKNKILTKGCEMVLFLDMKLWNRAGGTVLMNVLNLLVLFSVLIDWCLNQLEW